MNGAACSVFAFVAASQTARAPAPAVRSQAMSPEKAMELAEQGHCKEAMGTLKRTLVVGSDAAEKKRAGLLGVRCAMTTGDRSSAEELLQVLGRTFPHDPEVLYVTVHAYSDLSTKAAQELAESAPDSVQARNLTAESLELQGKWDDAAKQYEEILKKAPEERGIHFRLGRLYLSKPGATPEEMARGKEELRKEVEVDPKNTVALYVLGEMARQESDWPEAIAKFSSAAKLDANFGDAFLGWGASLISVKKFEEAIAPLRQAARLEPGNTAAHYNLGMALLRTGKKEEADAEFAIQKKLLAEQEAAKNAQPGQNAPQ